jgi:hypothetical protein
MPMNVNLTPQLEEMVRNKLSALRAHLAEGKAQAERGEFVGGFSMKNLLMDSE